MRIKQSGHSAEPLPFPTVMVNDYAGHPFQIDLSRELASRGHEVIHTFCSTNVTPRGDLDEKHDGLRVVGISTGRGFDKYNARRRLLAEVRYGVSSARQLAEQRPDIIINSNVPVVSLAIVSIVAKMLRIPSVLWLQDLQSGLVAMVLGDERHPIARAITWLENRCIRSADHVVTISTGFERESIAIGQEPDRVTTIPNWAPIDDLPLVERNNAWAARHDLCDRVVYLYSGTLGMKHRPEALLDLSRRLEQVEPNAVVVVISESVGAEWLADQRTEDEPLANLRILPFQPFDQLPLVLGSADVLVSLLEPDAGEFSVPSKVLTYLCAGRAVLGLMPSNNAATRLVVDDADAGLVADAMDAFLHHSERLATDKSFRAMCGARARTYAESTFPVRAITDRFEQVFEYAALGGRPAPVLTGTNVSTDELVVDVTHAPERIAA